MKQTLLTITTIILSMTLSMAAQARKPAVEDVFSVISADYEVVPKGQEVAVNFNQTNAENTAVMGKLDQVQAQASTSPWFAFLGFLALISLPALIWFQITHNHSSLKTPDNTAQDTKQNSDVDTSKVAKLDDYRKTTQEEETHKKAS